MVMLYFYLFGVFLSQLDAKVSGFVQFTGQNAMTEQPAKKDCHERRRCYTKSDDKYNTLPDNLFNFLFVLEINLLSILRSHKHCGVTE